MADRVLKVHFETESSADSGPVSTDLTLTSPSSNPAFRSILTMSEHKRYKFVANTLQFLPDKTPKNVFIIRRFWGDQAVILKKFIDVLDFLCQNYGQVNIFLEKKELNTWFGENCVLPDGLNPPEGLKDGKFEYIDTENINSKSTIKKLREQHLVVTLGGDGTLLHAISLFQDATTDVPPCLPIAFGSLGFLTPIKWDHYTKVLNRLLLPNTSGRDRSVSDLYEKETNASNYGSLNSNSSRKSQDGGISLTPDPKFFRLESVKTFNSISSERGVNFERLETPQETGPSLDVTTEKMIKSESTPVLVPKLRCDSILEENLFDDNQPIFVTKRTRIFAKCKKRENRSEYCQNSNSYENSSRDGSSEYLSGLDSFVNLNLESKPINTQTRSSSYKRFVLNEVLIDRGPNAGSLHLEIYINNKMIADVRGDGVILATPTGSTAYSLSAGASIVHPSTVGCIITPICPHSLSLRPLIIPPGIKIQIRAAADARILPYVSYDGSHQHRLEMEDEISIILPEKVEEHGGFVVPCICLRDPVDDFFASLSNCLHWNSNVFQQKSVS